MQADDLFFGCTDAAETRRPVDPTVDDWLWLGYVCQPFERWHGRLDK